jgi:hypothetical protein
LVYRLRRLQEKSVADYDIVLLIVFAERAGKDDKVWSFFDPVLIRVCQDGSSLNDNSFGLSIEPRTAS